MGEFADKQLWKKGYLGAGCFLLNTLDTLGHIKITQ